MGKQWKHCQTLFGGAPKSLQMVTAAMKLKDACSLEKRLGPPRHHSEKQTHTQKKKTHYFANKGPSSQSGFSNSHVWMWELDHKESWALRIDVFELWCWRRLLRVPWTARRSSQSILKEISPEYSLEGLMLKLKLQYFGHQLTLWKRPWCRERLKEGVEREVRGWDGWMVSPTRWTWVWASSRSWWWTRKPGVLQSMGSQRVRHNWPNELNWVNTQSSFLHVFSQLDHLLLLRTE